MDVSLTGVAVAALAFAVTFGIVRVVVSWVNKRRRDRSEAQALRQQSRQVRRALARKHKG